MTPGAERDQNVVWLAWLTRLRWVALFAQVVTLGFSFQLLESVTLLFALGGVMCALLLANLRAMQLLSRTSVPDETLLWQLALDVLALTAFFLAAGGPSNPFTLLYVIHVAMGAVMLRPTHAGALTLGVLACYGTLHLGALPLHYERHSMDPALLGTLGHLAAFTVTTVSVAVFVVGLSDALRHRRQQLLEARDRTSRTDRLRSVGTMAAGAAHELNTPLSTIGLRLRRVRRRHTDDDTNRDLEVMQAQLDRCTRVVEQLLAGAGDPSAAGFERAPLGDLVGQTVKLWSRGNEADVVVHDRSEGALVELPRVAFSQALINLLENAREAQEASDSDAPLEVTVSARAERATVELRDHGCGLPEEPDQVGTPFFTTKATGTGLGVFVARQVADGAGGGLSYSVHPDGTTARWWFPVAAPRRSTHEPEGQPEPPAGGG